MITVLIPTSAPTYIVIDGTASTVKGDPATVSSIITPPSFNSFLLMETSDFLLTESNFKFILE